MGPLRLHINIDHVATVRNQRDTSYPDPYTAARLCLAAGADGITVHLREDRRHIRDADVERLCASGVGLINLEMAATEAMFLMFTRVFDELGYRRLEWKCNDLNEPSKQAARRLGFTYEGTFRQHMIVKGRNRDTAWFSLLDSEWPAVRANMERWLSPANFDAEGRQRTSLSALNAALRQN